MNDRIRMTKKVLSELLNMIPADSYFNVVSFGSSYLPMFESSQKKTETNIKDATDKIATFDSDLGGTNIYDPLNYVLLTKEIEHYPKNIILLTDGQVENEDKCIKLVKSYERKINFKLYSIGIGNGVSKSFIQNTA